MDVVGNPTKIPTLSNEEYRSKLFEIRAKAILSGTISELSNTIEQFNNLTKLRESSKSNNQSKTIISNNNNGFDIKI